MRLIAFGVCILLGLVYSAPPSADDKIVITEEFYPEEFVVATANHDIVNILVPLNGLNYVDEVFENEQSDMNIMLFFTEADTDSTGKKVYKGLYVLKEKTVTKLLDQGTDAAADSDNSKTAYFAAKDGIYKYNSAENKAEKYGSIDDSIINIAKMNNTDTFYILTEDHVVYKVTGECTKKEKIADITDAQQIVLDVENNLYFYTPSKEVFVANADGIKKIEGLPSCTTIDLLKPPFVMDNGIPVILDKQSYLVYPNGTSEYGDFEVRAKPTAYDMVATVVQFYAYNKKIYEYDLLEMVLGQLIEELKTYLEEKKDTIQGLSTILKKTKA